MTTNTKPATWTATHTHFANGGAGKVYSHPTLPVSVVKGYHVETGLEGWAFQYAGLFSTETHKGFRTMAAAKAAAVAYATASIFEAHAAADAFRD